MITYRSRNETRALYFSSWEKYINNLELTALETQIIDVILAHPEYQQLFAQKEEAMSQDYAVELNEVNPFLHMGLHLAVRDQIATNRPLGIKPIYRKLIAKYHDPLEAEHRLMQVLAETLWQTQKTNQPPNDATYLKLCKSLLK